MNRCLCFTWRLICYHRQFIIRISVHTDEHRLIQLALCSFLGSFILRFIYLSTDTIWLCMHCYYLTIHVFNMRFWMSLHWFTGTWDICIHTQNCCFRLINFLKYILRNERTYTIINASWRNMWWVWKKKTKTQHWFSYFTWLQVLKGFKTHPLNINFDDLGIWLPGYRIEFNCLYLQHGHYFICTLWLWSTDKCDCFYFLSESRMCL